MDILRTAVGVFLLFMGGALSTCAIKDLWHYGALVNSARERLGATGTLIIIALLAAMIFAGYELPSPVRVGGR